MFVWINIFRGWGRVIINVCIFGLFEVSAAVYMLPAEQINVYLMKLKVKIYNLWNGSRLLEFPLHFKYVNPTS